MKITNCNICRCSEFTVIDYIDKWNHEIFDGKKIFLCKSCGFGQIFPSFTKDEIINYYETVYRSKKCVMHIDYESLYLDPKTLDYRSASQLLLAKQYIEKKDTLNFLDIGAGSGDSFVTANHMFGCINLFAIESNLDAQKFYKKNFTNITICESLTDINVKIDLLLMSHSLEHFQICDIPKLLNDISSILDENGILIVEVPHADFRSVLFEKNRFSDTPHFSFFSIDSLKQLFEMHGFEFCYINTVGFESNISFSDDMRIKREANHRCYTHKLNTDNIKYIIKKCLSPFGLYKVYRLLRTFFTTRQFAYDNFNFNYGGERDLLRCVLKKKV